MRKSIINSLFYGDISPWERNSVDTPERVQNSEKIDTEREHFKSTMTRDEYKRLIQLEDLYTRAASFEEEECFACGLKTGILLMMEVLAKETAQP